jgi:hypothetical protein
MQLTRIETPKEIMIFLCLTKHHATKTFLGVETNLHALVT